ncbi:peroxiredoxin [Candidatus Magnetomonas plexicatena]|uniref:peroxiredoxin n=1 Tax=Candidatus Magnetomonas plexicatena TaxID=2552947 RepID=UPI00110355EF|nr:peroxiredoxin [Nitrospirales bacterium LBB_01]
MTINSEDKAPDFCLFGIDESEVEKEFCLSELLKQEKQLILYFYPKDNTPGCTQESCDFRDNYARLTLKALVFGISRDSIASHIKFKEKHGLNFPLLSDPDHKVLELYGAWGEKKMYGKSIISTIRTTVLINKDGKIKKIWNNVKVKGHVDEVLSEL